MSRFLPLFGLLVLLAPLPACMSSNEPPALTDEWRALPLIENGKPHPAWQHTGHGTFTVHDGALRTDCSPQGLGLLVYTAEQFGDCQIRVIYRADPPRSNAGVYVRIADGILAQLGKQPQPVERDAAGKLSDAELKKMMDASEREIGPWYAVHHGFEVQICDGADPWHRTGAIYSLAKSDAAGSQPQPGAAAWKSLTITLTGDRILVDVGDARCTEFDSSAPAPPRKQWHEPKREPVRPRKGYIGLQNHDPGDVVYFKEVSVRKVPGK